MADVLIQHPARALTSEQFHRLAEVPAELEWFVNISSEKTRQAYQNDIHAFTRFIGIEQPQEFRVVTRAHVIAWRKTLEEKPCSDATLRRKLSVIWGLPKKRY
ncbi:MAG: site-specific integrase [Candidatus Thermoplasmatota archaeon]|nr:site-specific integrase [Candidatus Thermoplasmatota archaeon]